MTTANFRRGLADGRLMVLLLLLLYGAVWHHLDAKEGWVAAWRHVRVAGMEPRMVDMRGMLGAFESYRKGVPMAEIQNPPPGSSNISFTYPESWMVFAPIGLTTALTGALTLAAFVLGVAAWLVFIGPLTLMEGFFYGLILISPSLMLGVERGNGDLFLFVLILLACVLAAQRGLAAQILGDVLFVCGGALKVYPAAGLVASLKTWRSTVVAVLCGALFVAFMYVDRVDMQRVKAYTSRASSHSFGANVLTDALHLPAAYGYAAAGVLIAAAALLAWTRKSPVQLEPNRLGTAFLACSGMHVFCFLLGNNYEYRYRLFLLMLPQALLWARQKIGLGVILAAGMFLTVFATNEPRLWILSEALNWMLFGLLLYVSLSLLRTNLRACARGHVEHRVRQ